MIRCRRELLFKIPGPTNLDDRIAIVGAGPAGTIVGAGPAGIHMALSLKERGFRRVVILEKTNRFGGKVLTLHRRGAAQDMGAAYLAPDYNDLVVPLIKKYAPGDLVDLPTSSIWSDNSSEPIILSGYIIKRAIQAFNVFDVKVVGLKLVQKVLQYVELHRKLFGDYEGELMPEPPPKV